MKTYSNGWANAVQRAHDTSGPAEPTARKSSPSTVKTDEGGNEVSYREK